MLYARSNNLKWNSKPTMIAIDCEIKSTKAMFQKCMYYLGQNVPKKQKKGTKQDLTSSHILGAIFLNY